MKVPHCRHPSRTQRHWIPFVYSSNFRTPTHDPAHGRVFEHHKAGLAADPHRLRLIKYGCIQFQMPEKHVIQAQKPHQAPYAPSLDPSQKGRLPGKEKSFLLRPFSVIQDHPFHTNINNAKSSPVYVTYP
jgi:hypothetical protein